MSVYTKAEVLVILTDPNHRHFTAEAVGKSPGSVTIDELFHHWDRTHPEPKHVHRFNVEPREGDQNRDSMVMKFPVTPSNQVVSM